MQLHVMKYNCFSTVVYVFFISLQIGIGEPHHQLQEGRHHTHLLRPLVSTKLYDSNFIQLLVDNIIL